MKFSLNLHKMLVKMSVLTILTLLVSTSSSAQISLRRALDYDGDGRADAAVFRPTNNTWYIQRSGGGFQAVQFGVSSTDVFTPGDYDGDGRGDICVWRETDGTFYFLRSSNGTFGAVQWGITGDEPVARNWDNDNITDFAVVRRTGSSMFWYIRESAANFRFRGEQFGLASDLAVPGDYDGDGKFDVGVQRLTANNGPASFYYLNSNNGAFNGVQWGLSNDYAVPGDYDGDSRTDIAVVRDVAGTLNWYIRRSGGTTPGALLSYAWGASGSDLLAQNDYDGDGITDVAVWRDTNGTFYIRKSTDGQVLGINWGTSGDFPIAAYDTH